VSTYIYAITSAGHPLRLDGLKGVGEPANELRTVRTDALAAVISDAPGDLRAKRRDLVAHQGDGPSRVRMFRSFDPAASHDLDVPDPYYGDGDGFTEVLEMVEAAMPGLLDWVRTNR